MSISARISLLGAAIAITSLAPVARADNFNYSWNGYDGAVSAQNNDAGNGGRFRATLLDVTTNNVLAYGSYCNELGQNIGSNVQPVAVYSLNSPWLPTATLDPNGMPIGTYGGANDGPLGNVYFGWHPAPSQAGRNELAYLVATHWTEAQNTPLTTAIAPWDPAAGGAGNEVKESALELAIWHMWGFDNVGAYGSGPAGSAGQIAADWVVDAQTHSAYDPLDADVLWVHFIQPPLVDGGAPTGYQDQIMYAPPGSGGFDGAPLVPESSSLALLLPGLIPIFIAVRRRSRARKQ